jgi:hypothetical protein
MFPGVSHSSIQRIKRIQFASETKEVNVANAIEGNRIGKCGQKSKLTDELKGKQL